MLRTSDYERELSTQASVPEPYLTTTIINGAWNASKYVGSMGFSIASSPFTIANSFYQSYYPTPTKKITQLNLSQQHIHFFEKLPDYVQTFIAQHTDSDIKLKLDTIFSIQQSKQRCIDYYVDAVAIHDTSHFYRQKNTATIKKIQEENSLTLLFLPVTMVLCEFNCLSKYEIVFLESHLRYITAKNGFFAITNQLLNFSQLCLFVDAEKISTILSDKGIALLQSLFTSKEYDLLLKNLASALCQNLLTIDDACNSDLKKELLDFNQFRSNVMHKRNTLENNELKQELLAIKLNIEQECAQSILKFYAEFEEKLPNVFVEETERDLLLNHLSEQINQFYDQYSSEKNHILDVHAELLQRIQAIPFKSVETVSQVDTNATLFSKVKNELIHLPQDLKQEALDTFDFLSKLTKRS